MSKKGIVKKYQDMIVTVKGEKDMAKEVGMNKKANELVLKQQLNDRVLQPSLAKKDKLTNKIKLMKRDYNIAEMSNDISEKISQAYDKNFYSNYDIWNNLDNKINTQTSIIHINNKNQLNR